MNPERGIPETELDTLEWQGFEWLVQTLVKAQFGLGIEAWGESGDWGCDAYFNGELRYPTGVPTQGTFVFQCKSVQNANAAGADVKDLILRAVRNERDRIRERQRLGQWMQPSEYILCTNARLDPELREKVKSELSTVLQECRVRLHQGKDICQWLSLTPQLTHGFRADTELCERLAGLGLRSRLDALRSSVLSKVLGRARRLDELARASHLFDLGLLMTLQNQDLDLKEKGQLLLSAVELIQDVRDENPSYIRHRALLIASQLAPTVPGFPWLDQCPRIQDWLKHHDQDKLDLGDHWLIALTVLAADESQANRIAATYDGFAPRGRDEREHATLNLAEGIRSVLVSAGERLPSPERVLRVIRWVELGYLGEGPNLSGAGQIRLLLLCGDLINIVKVCSNRPGYGDVVKLAEERIEAAMRGITRQPIKRMSERIEKLKTIASTPPWRLEETYLHDDEFWFQNSETGLRDTLLDLYDVAVEERDKGEYKGAGWTKSWLPYFKDLGRTSKNQRIQSISERAVDKDRGPRST